PNPPLQGGATGGWECDITQVKAAALNDDVVEFMAVQLQKLPVETQEMLKLAACIGNSFDLTTLAIVSEKSPVDAAADLWKVLQEGLILPISETYKFFQSGDAVSTQEISVSYRFLHDRVQQAAYSLIPNTKKQTTHLKIGRLILLNTPEEKWEDKIFSIVTPLNTGAELIDNLDEKTKIAHLNLIAGRKAKNSTAYEAAEKYLKSGIALLSGKKWSDRHELTLSLFEEIAETAYLRGNFKEMEKWLEEILANAQTLLDRIKAYEIKIGGLTAQDKAIEALETGINLLKQLGISITSKPTDEEVSASLQQSKILWEGKDPLSLISLPIMSGTTQLAIVKILSALIPPAYFTDANLFCMFVFEAVKLGLQYGHANVLPFPYACYGFLLIEIAGETDLGYRFGKLAIEVADKLNEKAARGKAIEVFNGHIQHWKGSLNESLNSLLQGYQDSLDAGDIEYAAYNSLIYCYHSYFAGNELSIVKQQMDRYGEVIERFNHAKAIYWHNIYHQAAIDLMFPSHTPEYLSGDIYDEFESLPLHLKAKDNGSLGTLYLNKTIICYLLSSPGKAMELSDKVAEYLGGLVGQFGLSVWKLYDSLIRLALYPDLPEAQQQEYLEKVSKNQIAINKWAQNAPMNYQHKADLVRAEQHRVLGRKFEAADLYDRAISLAKENGYIQEEALANELAAKFYLDWGKEKVAAGYMQEAYYCYARWGAKAKVVDLETRYRQLLAPILQRAQMGEISPLTTSVNTLISLQQTVSSSSTTSISNLLDLGTVLKAAQALYSEIHLDKLLATIMQVIVENSGADKAALFLDRDGELEVVIKYLDNGIQCFSPKPVDECKYFPTAVIHYVERTLETLIPDVKIHPSILSDSYFIQHQPQSLLCTPILNQGKLIGVLYLENSLTKGAFTKERVELLKLLCSQAAISLANARLYQQSQTYAQQISQKSQQLEQTLQELQTMQLQLVQNEKMSALGNLVAGVAHEINNPVGFLAGNIQPALDSIEDLLGLIDLYQEKYPQIDPEIEDKIETIDLEFVREDLPKLVGSMREGVDRIANISTSLRTFSRADSDTPVAFNLHEGIDSTILILKHRLKANENRPEIKVIKNYGQIPQVECFAGQLNQVFMNILANAIDALEESNQDRSFAEIEANPNLIVITSECSENKTSVFVRIKDNGRGMPEEVKQKIFEHLFTTKAVGKGTGLGLAIAHQIVAQKHKGLLAVNSTFGQGAEFIIALPVT
ncbi:ATP-binding protein, partial [Microcoleus sp. herbarium7]|uniref:trifunctional serine/threonine-protein kinase/ATP-binding protein/sensor histidine kinase n=1 Tax=Microcoleus sp. herbarium7 TaxID=3055435 RepID=UPI002FD3AD09